MIISTGNTLVDAQPDLTLATRLENSIKTWLSKHPGMSRNDMPSYVAPPCSATSLGAVEISAKLFLPPGVSGEAASCIFQEVAELCRAPNRSPIKNFVISLQGLTFSDSTDTWSNEALFDIWNRLVSCSEIKALVENFGIAECSAQRLGELINATEIKPVIDQINATECCALPPALLQLAKRNNVKLLAHHDIEDILPSSDLISVLGKPDAKWKWILRLTCIAQDRQVLLCNENLVCI